MGEVRPGVAPPAQDLGCCGETAGLLRAEGFSEGRPMAQPAFRLKPLEAVVGHAGGRRGPLVGWAHGQRSLDGLPVHPGVGDVGEAPVGSAVPPPPCAEVRLRPI